MNPLDPMSLLDTMSPLDLMSPSSPIGPSGSMSLSDPRSQLFQLFHWIYRVLLKLQGPMNPSVLMSSLNQNKTKFQNKTNPMSPLGFESEKPLGPMSPLDLMGLSSTKSPLERWVQWSCRIQRGQSCPISPLNSVSPLVPLSTLEAESLGGLTRIMPHFTVLSLPQWPICSSECGKFLTYFGHNFCPVTHYGMVTKRWNRRVNIHTYYEQQILLETYLSRFGPKTDLHFSKCKGGRRIGQIFILT